MESHDVFHDVRDVHDYVHGVHDAMVSMMSMMMSVMSMMMSVMSMMSMVSITLISSNGSSNNGTYSSSCSRIGSRTTLEINLNHINNNILKILPLMVLRHFETY